MLTVTSIAELRAVVKNWKQAGETIALVPTMGNLHQGHLKLVEQAKASANRTVVSLFVNPTQFGVGEDFEKYPRTEQEDSRKLSAAEVDLLFLPSVLEIYGQGVQTVICVKNLSTIHCGAYRSGHFDGVATVVCKLFNIVQPDMAIFGKKDFQQLTLIKVMVNDLNLPIVVIPVETARQHDGLALSSRNGYLTEEELQIAPKLYQSLMHAQAEVQLGKKPFQQIMQDASAYLRVEGFLPDYFVICRQDNLQLATVDDNELVILVAAKLGKTRLIDNVSFKK